MTIKTKLIANALLTALIIVALSAASYVSIRFLREKLSYLTRQSTPFQVYTLELQRELQVSITGLTKVTTARTMADYAPLRAEAEAALARVRETQHALNRLKGISHAPSNELDMTARELFAAVENRIRSNDAAVTANESVVHGMETAAARLDALDDSIHRLQTGYANAFSAARETTDTFSERLGSIEDLRNLVKELQLITVSIQGTQNSSALLIARAKLKAVTGRIAKNAYYAANTVIATATNRYAEMLGEYLRLQSQALNQKQDEVQHRAAEYGKDLPYKLNDLFQTLDQESMLVRDELSFAAARQETVFRQSRSATDILEADSDLLELGLRVTAATNSLFTLESPEELAKRAAEIRTLFTTISERTRAVEQTLTKLRAADELKTLYAATAALTTIRNNIYRPDGILTTLQAKLRAVRQANSAAEKLNAIVTSQTALGNTQVGVARYEQEQSITAVNRTVARSLSQITGFGLVAIVIGIFFGFWIYRSVVPPLRVVLDAVRSQQVQGRERARLAEAVAGGDLDHEVAAGTRPALTGPRINRDEMGQVLKAVVGMNESQEMLDRALAGMTASLRLNRDADLRRSRLQNGLHELDRVLRGEQRLTELADQALGYLIGFLKAGVGVIYRYDAVSELLVPLATYATGATTRRNTCFRLGEGLVGQVARERKPLRLTPAPAGYLPISSALGSADPLHILVLPIKHNDQLTGVLELGSFRRFAEDDLEFLTQALEAIAVAFTVGFSRETINDLLEQSQTQAEELRAQQEELQQTNEELAERARLLLEQRGTS